MEARGLTKRFGGIRANDNIDFSVRRGELRGIIGPNGAGKSTFFKMLTCEIHPSEGRILFEGRDITGFNVTEVCQLGLTKSYQVNQFFTRLSVRENITIAALADRRGPFRLDLLRHVGSVRGLTQRVEDTLELVHLTERADLPVSELAYGEKRRLEIGLALATAPSLLLLDEPLAGMSPRERLETLELLRSIARQPHHDHHRSRHGCDLRTRRTDHRASRRLCAGGGNAGRNKGKRGGPGSLSWRCACAMSLLEVKGLNSYYGDSHILFDVDLRVEKNEVVALLGRNGAGKSTTLKSLMGVVRPRAGEVILDGQNLAGQPPHRIAQAGIQLVPEDRRIFGSLNVEENIILAGLTASNRWPLDRIYAMFPPLKERRGSRGVDLSGGEQQMLAIARALVRDPKIVLLDEPFEGLAPVIVHDLMRACADLASAGQTIVLVEQNIAATLTLASRAYIVNNGHIVHEGPTAEIKADPGMLRRYLGV